ncbi:MAG: transcriptional repressor [Endomicrobiia bacterium]|jgi:Fur family ferric uptake transcriptional regulator|nr:transcriptional repressor [Endomicrobiaceae bacterium]MDD3052994.1 transcriptional repressor [Endomicrobiaceae bacterium]MDD3923328.1 transcriptional repressor [Endomicrobiaceae bacterium]MDD5102660.1 transcriptional repressor [Endomicrobiaceae bacterium]
MPCNKFGWHGKFKECGYRVTVGRKEILDVLTKTTGHLSAEEIYLKVHEKYQSIGLTTVYRTLDVLASIGLLQKFDFGDGRARYEIIDATNEKGHHHHLVCTECKRIIDYKDFIDEEVELLRKTEKALSEKYKFEIKNHLIQFYGLCSECQEHR